MSLYSIGDIVKFTFTWPHTDVDYEEHYLILDIIGEEYLFLALECGDVARSKLKWGNAVKVA